MRARSSKNSSSQKPGGVAAVAPPRDVGRGVDAHARAGALARELRASECCAASYTRKCGCARRYPASCAVRGRSGWIRCVRSSHSVLLVLPCSGASPRARLREWRGSGSVHFALDRSHMSRADAGQYACDLNERETLSASTLSVERESDKRF